MVQGVAIAGDIDARVARVRERIAQAAVRSGRDPDAITLIAVTKTMSAERVRAAALAGISDVGENRVQEAAPKIAELAGGLPLRWHLIGHLQRNKARRAAELFDVIHSIDSLDLGRALSRAAGDRGREIETFVQVNVSGESTKHGYAPEDLFVQAEELAQLQHLRWRGLMTIAPEEAGESDLRAVFAATRKLHADLARVFDGGEWNALSMGMSNDFELAIAEGATHVRVGRAIFGERAVAMQG